MKTKNRILLIISFAPLFITAIALIFMNDTIPVHFNFNGEVDRYGSKFEYLILPVITLAFYVFWKLYIKFYASSNTDDIEKSKSNINVLTILAIVVNSLFGVLQCVFVAIALLNPYTQNNTIELLSLVNYVMSIAFIVIGNYLPKTKRNSFMGVRTSWTKKSDKNWYVTNRNAGIAFVISGVLSIAVTAVISGTVSTFIMLIITIVSLLISYIYSYIKVTKSA